MNINRAHKNAKDVYDKWCQISLKIENEYFKYKKVNDEILLECEIEDLIREFYKTLTGDLQQDRHISFLEPDLEFILYPCIQANEKVIVDLRINLFQDGALSVDYYNLCLEEEEIEHLLIYLNQIIPTIKLERKI